MEEIKIEKRIRKKCQHGTRKSRCKKCHGSGICEHKIERYVCRICKGTGICKHGIRKQICKDCDGSGICKHKRLKYDCIDCVQSQCNICLIIMTPGNMARHYRTVHSAERQLRQKKEETKFENFLKQNAILYDREVFVNFKCDIGDRDKQYARLDFLIHHNNIYIVEMDENQHQWYTLSCELSRMCQVNQLLFEQYNVNGIVWIRFNPNAYKVDNLQMRVSRETRYERILKFIKDYPEIETGPVVNVHYCYYDMANNDPVILSDDDYAPEFKKFVKESIY